MIELDAENFQSGSLTSVAQSSKDAAGEEMTSKEIVHFIEARKATMFGQVERLRELLDSGQVSVDAADPDECTLLHWAAINNRLEVKMLL